MAQYRGWAPWGVFEAWPQICGISCSCGCSASSSGHAWPPESFSEEAKHAVSALMTQIMVASIYSCLPLQSRHHKYQDVFVTPFRCDILGIEKIALEHNVLLAGGVDAAFSIWDLCFINWSKVWLLSFLLLSQSITSRMAQSPHWATTHCESAKFW